MKKAPKKPDVYPCTQVPQIKGDVELSHDQVQAAEKISQAVDAGRFEALLLDGVTGSGKTEVYFQAMSKIFEKGGQVLILLPEIGLSTAFVKRFHERFGIKPAMWHSEITPANRRKVWNGVLRGETKCVIGARSAMFLPFPNLHLIIVDEEHDPSYKQEDGVIYNARDMAIVRANFDKAPVVLASATPSLETMENVWSGKYTHLVLPERFGAATMPDIHMIDMREEKTTAQTFIGAPLRNALEETLAKDEQALLFLNRRGYAPLTLCRKCGYRFECPSCTAWLVDHRKTGALHCHHCDYSIPRPHACPECETEDSLAACGPGVERIAEEVAAILPDAKPLVLSSDITESPKNLAAALSSIQSGEVDVIIGTQMIAKGYHFPRLTTVGVVDADIGLSGGDMRAAERTFQLLQQVSGRAGRADLKGHVYLQSFMPDHTVMQAIHAGDRDAFLAVEAAERKEAAMPPYGKLAALIISGKNDQTVKGFCYALARCAPRYDNMQILGPSAAMMSRLRGQYRWRFLIKTDKNTHLQNVISDWLSQVKQPSSIKLKVDIDPQSFF